MSSIQYWDWRIHASSGVGQIRNKSFFTKIKNLIPSFLFQTSYKPGFVDSFPNLNIILFKKHIDMLPFISFNPTWYSLKWKADILYYNQFLQKNYLQVLLDICKLVIYDKSISRTVRWSQLSTNSFIDIIGVF